MASFKAKFPVLQELFAKNHRGSPLGPPSGARVNIEKTLPDEQHVRPEFIFFATKTEPFKQRHFARKRYFAAAARVLFVLAIIKNKVFCQLMLSFQRDVNSDINIVLCTSGIKDFVYQRAEGELINRIFNATSA